MKFVLAAGLVTSLTIVACRPLQHNTTIPRTRVGSTASGKYAQSVVTKVMAVTESPPVLEGLSPSDARLVTAIPTTTGPTMAPRMSEWAKYELGLTAEGFERPVYLTHSSDGSGRLFVVEQGGLIWIIQDGKILSPAFLDISDRVSRGSEQGLLGLAFDPDYIRNGYFFVHYTDRNGDTVVTRLGISSDPNRADPSSEVQVLTHSQPYRNHNGGQISFGPDSYLYIGLGDGGWAGDPHDNGQNLQTWLGAILRLDVGQNPGFVVPSDNPFVTSKSAAPEIWVYGLRNPWRFSFDRLNGDMYIGDVGQNDWEEIDFQSADSTGGENYGWGVMEGDHCYKGHCDSQAYVAPIAEYHHSDGGCSVTGGYVYRGEQLKDLRGVYVYGDYCSGLISALFKTNDGVWNTTPLIESSLKISSFGEDELGEVYVVDRGGGIYRLREGSDAQ